MSQMLDPEKINKALSEFHKHETISRIKVTSEFAQHLQTITIKEPIYDSLLKRCTYIPPVESVPVEIDDEIDGPYEFVFNKENENERQNNL